MTDEMSEETLATLERAARAVAPGHWYIRNGEPDSVRSDVEGRSPETFRYVIDGRAMATDAYYVVKAQPERVLALIAEVRCQRARNGVVTGEHEKTAREICRPYHPAEPIANAPPIESAIAEALAAERAAGAREMRERAVAAIDAARERECAEYGGYDADRVDDGMSAARCIVEALPLEPVKP